MYVVFGGGGSCSCCVECRASRGGRLMLLCPVLCLVLGLFVVLGCVLSVVPVCADCVVEVRFYDEVVRCYYDVGCYDVVVCEFMIGQCIVLNLNTFLNIVFCFRVLECNEEVYMYFVEFLVVDIEYVEWRA